MKLLVIGREGQLARSMAARARRHPTVAVEWAARPQIDLERSETIAPVIGRSGPDVILNAAAWTAVDLAEREPARAEQVNRVAPGILAEAAEANGARLIHISTDYVFSGAHGAPFDEQAPTAPLSVYGRTKLAGEHAVRAVSDRHVVIRTAWVYSPFGRNFVKTMLSLAASRDRISVVADQIGSPTSALDLADGIFSMIEMWRGQPEASGGLWHLAGSGQASWCDLASEAIRLRSELGGNRAEVLPITTADYPTDAPRPAWSVLDSSAFAATYGYRMPDWRISLAEVVKRLSTHPS